MGMTDPRHLLPMLDDIQIELQRSEIAFAERLAAAKDAQRVAHEHAFRLQQESRQLSAMVEQDRQQALKADDLASSTYAYADEATRYAERSQAEATSLRQQAQAMLSQCQQAVAHAQAVLNAAEQHLQAQRHNLQRCQQDMRQANESAVAARQAYDSCMQQAQAARDNEKSSQNAPNCSGLAAAAQAAEQQVHAARIACDQAEQQVAHAQYAVAEARQRLLEAERRLHVASAAVGAASEAVGIARQACSAAADGMAVARQATGAAAENIQLVKQAEAYAARVAETAVACQTTVDDSASHLGQVETSGKSVQDISHRAQQDLRLRVEALLEFDRPFHF